MKPRLHAAPTQTLHSKEIAIKAWRTLATELDAVGTDSEEGGGREVPGEGAEWR